MKFSFLLYFILKITNVLLVACKSCYKEELTKCDFILTKNPVAKVAQIHYNGISLEQCVNKIGNFNWEKGVYCEISNFCELGIDLERNYHNAGITSTFQSLNERCYVIIDKKNTNCEEVKDDLKKSGILRGRKKSSRFKQ